MHVAAVNPARIAASDVPKEEVERERAIFLEQAKNDPKSAGKPQEIVEKIGRGQGPRSG